MEKNNHTTSKDARPRRDALPCVSTHRNTVVRLITLGLLAAAAIAIASLTVGRDIYYGSAEEGMTSFAIVNFAGYLFFLFMPVELAFIYYVSEGVNLWTLNGIAIGTALLSQTIDYLIGYSFSTRIINRLIGRKRYLMAESRIRKFGNIAIVVFNALPLSSPVISLSAGILKLRAGEAFVYTVTGLLIKYMVLTLIFS
jgi:membrane protein YqaA with SNARE-associated domain